MHLAASTLHWRIFPGVARGYIGVVYPGADAKDAAPDFQKAYPKATMALILARAFVAARCLDYVLAEWSVPPCCRLTSHRTQHQNLTLSSSAECHSHRPKDSRGRTGSLKSTIITVILSVCNRRGAPKLPQNASVQDAAIDAGEPGGNASVQDAAIDAGEPGGCSLSLSRL
jgi:hypothetical protein